MTESTLPPAHGPLDEASVRKAYSRWAPVYDAVFALPFFTGRRAVASIINRLPPGRVLEAGVGTGMALPLYDRRHELHGIDLSPEMLAKARVRVARKGLANVAAIKEMDAGNLAYPDRHFDAVIAMYVMTVVPDPDKVMAEFVRVTPPGGRLVVIGHFASTGGIYSWFERRLARYASRIGWNPDFPVSRLTTRPDLRLKRTRKLGPLWLFTLLEFERV